MFEEIHKTLESARAHRRSLEVDYYKNLDKIDKEIVKLRIDLQKHCSHPKTRKEDSFNYHNNTEWTTIYCTVCDKQLERY